MRYRWLTIRVAGFLLLTALFLTVSGLAELATAVRASVRSARTEVELVAADVRRELVRLIRAAPDRPLAEIARDPDLIATMKDALARAPSVLHVGVFSPDGIAVAHTQEHLVGALVLPVPSLPDVSGTWEVFRILRSFRTAPPTYQSETELLSDGRPYAKIRVVVAGAFLWDSIKPHAAREFATAAAILGLALLSVMLLERIITGRIRLLQEGVEALRKGEYDLALPEQGIGEFGRLAEELNRLGDQVKRERASGAATGAAIDESRTIAEIGRMAAGAAHELGNKLQGVHMELQALQSPDRLSPEEVRESARCAVAGLESLNRVVRGFLKMARIRPLAPSPVRPDELLREVGAELRQEAILAGIDIETAPADEIAEVSVDAEVIRQAIGNLVRNSIQAMGEGGGRIVLRSEVDGNRVRMTVADDGPGMAPEVRDHVFDLYYTTRKDGGGVGLPLVRQSVERHNGSVEIRSEVGKGTAVTLILPRYRSADTAARPARPPSTNERGRSTIS